MLFEFWSLQVTTEVVGLYPREWRMALQLADEHGFGVPDGWSKTPPTEVPEEQSRALGAALKRALPELPSEEHRQDVGAHPDVIRPPGERNPQTGSQNPLAYFGGSDRGRLAAFVRLCEAGAFEFRMLSW